VWFDLSLQNQAAETFGGFGNMTVGQAEFLFGVERGIGVVQTKAALRNFADAAPFARDDLENLANQLLRRLVAFAAHGAGILVFNLGAAGFELLHHHQHALQNIQRLETGDDNRHVIFAARGGYSQ